MRNVRPFAAFDSVAFLGSVIGFFSLAAGWLTLRPNRLAAGTSLNLWHISVPWWTIVFAVLWFACITLCFSRKPRAALLMGACADAILIATFVVAGTGSGGLLAGQSGIARVSLGGGFWLSVAGAYVVVFASRQRLKDSWLWRETLSWTGFAVAAALLGTGRLDHLSVLVEFAGYSGRFWQETLQHVRLFGGSVAIATVVGIVLGVWATRNRIAERPVFFITNIMQTVPSLALFGILIAPLSALSFAFPALRTVGIAGIGAAPALVALTIYSLLPIVQNTYIGIKRVDAAAVDAGQGMGMSRWQVFRRIEAPLAAPLVLEGIRTASVQAVGLTAVAALIGAGGLGWFIFQGIGQAAPDMIILGAIPIIIMALIVDALMRAAVRLGTPRGMLRRQ